MRIHSDLFDVTQLPHTMLALWQSIQFAETFNRQAKIKDAIHGAEIVTQADPACEKMVNELLQLSRNSDPITIGEESTSGERDFPSSFRTHDPIDGTNAFAFGTKRWGTLFAEFKNNVPVSAIALLAEGGSGISVVSEREEVLMWDLINSNSRKLDRPKNAARTLLYFPGYMPDSMAEKIEKHASGLGITLLPSSSAVDATIRLALGEACALYAHYGKIWDFAPSAALMYLWGGDCIDLDTQKCNTWGRVAMNVVLGYEPKLATELAPLLAEVNEALLPPDMQWVPVDGRRIFLRDVAQRG